MEKNNWHQVSFHNNSIILNRAYQTRMMVLKFPIQVMLFFNPKHKMITREFRHNK